MRLTDIMMRKFPRGHIYRGKYRLVKQVDAASLRRLRFDYEREEENMLLLRHPYLTVEQSLGHMKAMGQKKDIRSIALAERIQKFSKTTTLEDRLMHLKVKDAWD